MTPATPPLRVLIIDDEDLIRKQLRFLLKEMQIEDVSEASDGREALDILFDDSHPFPDIIITDLMMEGMDGIEFCNTVRRSEMLQNAGVPIVMLTAVTDRMLQGVSKQVGALSIVNKPITAEKLEHVIRSCISDVIAETI